MHTWQPDMSILLIHARAVSSRLSSCVGLPLLQSSFVVLIRSPGPISTALRHAPVRS